MRRLTWFAGGFCAAALLFGLGVPVLWLAVAAGTAALLSLSAFLLRRGRARCVAIALLGLAAGLGWTAGYQVLRLQPLQAWDGVETALWAQAIEETRPAAYGTATDVALSLDGRRYRAVLYCADDPALRPGDRVGGMVRLRVMESTGDYDLRASLRGEAEIQRCARTPVRFRPAALAMQLRAQLYQLLPEAEGSFAAALLTGGRSSLSDTLLQEMTLSGTRHLAAVSGMHLSIVVGALLLLLGRRQRLAALVGLPAVWCFALAVGMTPSVVRAAVMQSFFLLAPIFRRENDPPTAVLTALMLMILPDPRVILDVGLQLSFAAATGVLLFSGRILVRLEGQWYPVLRRRAGWLAGLVRAVLSGAAASLSVLPMTLPITLLHFDSVSLAAPLSGALLAPVIPWCFLLGLGAALLGMIWIPLGLLLAWPLRWGLWYCMAVIRLLARLPFAAVSAGSGYFFFFLIGLYALALHGAASEARGSVWVRSGCLVSLFLVCWLLQTVEYDRAELSVTMLDVGQGQCVYVAARGHGALYDCGGQGDPAMTAALFLQGRGALDFVVVSHYDADHAGGVPALLRRVAVETVFLPETPDENGIQAEILEAAQAQGCRTVFVTADIKVTFGGAEATLYAPAEAAAGNAGCIAVHWRAGDFDVLLTGDMGTSAETRLLQRSGLSDVEVLAAGHHGAASSTGTALLRFLRPEVVLISVGADNPYGHPDPETLARLEKSGAAVYRTDQCGNITVRR